MDSRSCCDGLVVAFDFDRTLTVRHTYRDTCLKYADGSRRVVLVPAKKTRHLLGIFSREVAVRIQDTPDFRHSITNQDIKSNLRNPGETKKIMQHIIDNGGKVCIISLHDNSAWIRRNLELLLEDEALLSKIEIYALQSDEHAKYLKNKVNVMINFSSNAGLTPDVILVDDDERERNSIAGYMEKLGSSAACQLDFIHAAVGLNDYLSQLALRVGCDLEAAACQEQAPSLAGFYHG